MKGRINKRFMENLKKKFGQKVFTTSQAEDLYMLEHEQAAHVLKEGAVEHECSYSDGTKFIGFDKTNYRRPTREESRKVAEEGIKHGARDTWACMSARNSLCMAVQRDLFGLKRIARGVYCFRNQMWEPTITIKRMKDIIDNDADNLHDYADEEVIELFVEMNLTGIPARLIDREYIKKLTADEVRDFVNLINSRLQAVCEDDLINSRLQAVCEDDVSKV